MHYFYSAFKIRNVLFLSLRVIENRTMKISLLFTIYFLARDRNAKLPIENS